MAAECAPKVSTLRDGMFGLRRPGHFQEEQVQRSGKGVVGLSLGSVRICSQFLVFSHRDCLNVSPFSWTELGKCLFKFESPPPELIIFFLFWGV